MRALTRRSTLMATTIEHDAMRRAIDAAGSVVATFPNPRVGCVLLDSSGQIIAIGVHRGAGTPHAEIDALNQAGAGAAGAIAVVTLEPCNHTGRTGPCSRALIAAGVTRVVYAQRDPNGKAAGGADTLRQAGIDVEADVLTEAAAAINVEWTHAITTGRPFVTWKYAATLDGLSAASDGSSKWITGPEARRDVQTFRAGVDAIVVGTGSVLADDPRLTVRDAEDNPLPYESQPLRVVVGESVIPRHYRVFDTTAPTLLIRSRDPQTVLKQLAEREIRHVWLEGGPRLAGAFWNAALIDRVIGYVAPAFLGAGLAALKTESTTLADLRPIDLTSIDRIGNDIRLIGTPLRAPREDFS